MSEVTEEDKKRLLIVMFLALIPVLWTMVASQTFFKAGMIYTAIAVVSYVFYKVG